VKSIRVIIASPVRLVRQRLAATLRRRRDLTVVEAVDLSPAGIERIAAAQVDVIVVDVGHIETSAAARLIKAANPGARLVAFGVDETVDQVFSCAAAGFSGYVPRESRADEVYRAVVDAMQGHLHCAPQIAGAMYSRLAGLFHELGLQGSLPSLTSREGEILSPAEQGSSNKEIARQLRISSATVKNHMHNILQKLQVTRRAQAVARKNASRGK
jgi:two-component system, NarL family, nitrate/nitrite response regulator NarL